MRLNGVEGHSGGILPLTFSHIHSVSLGSCVVVDENNMILNTPITSNGSYSNNLNEISHLDEMSHLDEEEEDFDEFDINSSNEFILNRNEFQKVLPEKRCQYLSRPLDSYQEEDLERIREQWQRALLNRHNYLESQIKQVSFFIINNAI